MVPDRDSSGCHEEGIRLSRVTKGQLSISPVMIVSPDDQVITCPKRLMCSAAGCNIVIGIVVVWLVQRMNRSILATSSPIFTTSDLGLAI